MAFSRASLYDLARISLSVIDKTKSVGAMNEGPFVSSGEKQRYIISLDLGPMEEIVLKPGQAIWICYSPEMEVDILANRQIDSICK